VGLCLFYVSAYVLSIPAVSEFMQPQMTLTLDILVTDVRYYVL